jgi:hypothetical protein
MRLRPHRRNLVVWSTSVGPVSQSGVPRLTPVARSSRSQRWIRTAGLLTVIGLIRLARAAARTRWRPLLAGGVLTVAGVVLRSGAGAVLFLPGSWFLLIALLVPPSSRAPGKRRCELERDLAAYSTWAQRRDLDLTSMSPWWGRPVNQPPQFASLVDASRRARKRAG